MADEHASPLDDPSLAFADEAYRRALGRRRPGTRARERAHRTAIRETQALFGPNDPHTIAAVWRFAEFLQQGSRSERATPRWMRIFRAQVERHGIPSLEVARTVERLANHAAWRYPGDDAIAMWCWAMALRRAGDAAFDPAPTYLELGRLASKHGRRFEAIPFLLEATNTTHVATAVSTWSKLADVHSDLGAVDQAEAAYRRALALAPACDDDQNPWNATKWQLGAFLEGCGRDDEAAVSMLESIAELGPRVDIPMVVVAIHVLLRLGRTTRARELAREFLAMRPFIAPESPGYRDVDDVLQPLARGESVDPEPPERLFIASTGNAERDAQYLHDLVTLVDPQGRRAALEQALPRMDPNETQHARVLHRAYIELLREQGDRVALLEYARNVSHGICEQFAYAAAEQWDALVAFAESAFGSLDEADADLQGRSEDAGATRRNGDKIARLAAKLQALPDFGVSETMRLVLEGDDAEVEPAAGYLAVLPGHVHEKQQTLALVLRTNPERLESTRALLRFADRDLASAILGYYVQAPDLHFGVFSALADEFPELVHACDALEPYLKARTWSAAPSASVEGALYDWREDRDFTALENLGVVRTEAARAALLELRGQVDDDDAAELIEILLAGAGVFPDTGAASVYDRTLMGIVAPRPASPHAMGRGFGPRVPLCPRCEQPAVRVLTLVRDALPFLVGGGADPSMFWLRCPCRALDRLYVRCLPGEIEPIATNAGPPREDDWIPGALALELLEHPNQYGMATQTVPGRAAHQVGGYPPWIDRDSFPECARCRQPMRFLAALDSGPSAFGLMPFSGTLFGFWCEPCSVSCTLEQGARAPTERTRGRPGAG